MTEAERLQKIVLAQGKELGRLRNALKLVRIAVINYEAADNNLYVTVTAIGCDEVWFIREARKEIEALAKALAPGVTLPDVPPIDSITGEEQIGGVTT